MTSFVKCDPLMTLTNGFCFGEGPRWFEGLLWFSDMLGEAVHTVTLDGDDDIAVDRSRPVRTRVPPGRVAADRLHHAARVPLLRR